MEQTTIKTVKQFYQTHRKKTIIVDGIKLEYLVGGGGKETFLILPGAGMIAQQSFRLMLALENRCKVISLNIYPASTIDQYCHFIDKILEEEKTENIVLYGISLGGMITQSYLRRHKKNIQSIIISHTTTPNSFSLQKIIRRFPLAKYLLNFFPEFIVKFIFKNIARRLQVINYNFIGDFIPQLNKEDIELHRCFSDLFFEKYLTKELLKTDIRLINDFNNNEKFLPDDLKNWQGKMLILMTDNDPLMHYDKQFKTLYPKAKTIIFTRTGHLTFYYQFEKMIKYINSFLDN